MWLVLIFLVILAGIFVYYLSPLWVNIPFPEYEIIKLNVKEKNRTACEVLADPPTLTTLKQAIPTIEEITETRQRLLFLTSRRLIQFVHARNEALNFLDPPKTKDGIKPPPNIEAALKVLQKTKELQ